MRGYQEIVMADELPQYFAVLTDVGAALEARALELGKGLVLSHIAVGDAELKEVTPEASVKALVREVHRRPIDARSRDGNDPRITLLHATIPADVGGFWIYEMGVYGHLEGETDEVLYAYANHGRYYKMLPQNGQTVTHEITIPVIQCTDAKITIEVADDGYATRQEYLLLSALVESLRHTQRAVWTLETEVAEGGELPLPEGIFYIPGHKALMLSWDGLTCHQGAQFAEVEAGEDRFARSVRLLFTAPAGSEFEIFVHGHSDALSLNDASEPTGLAARVDALAEELFPVAERAAYVAASTA